MRQQQQQQQQQMQQQQTYQLDFNQVLVAHRIRYSIVEYLLTEVFKQNTLCYVFGDFVRDEVAIQYVNVHNCKKIKNMIKQFLCNKFKRTQIFEINLVFMHNNEETFTVYLRFVYNAIKRYLNSMNSNQTFTFSVINSSLIRIEFRHLDLSFCVEVNNVFLDKDTPAIDQKLDISDFAINSLTMNQDGIFSTLPWLYNNVPTFNTYYVKEIVGKIIDAYTKGDIEITPHRNYTEILSQNQLNIERDGTITVNETIQHKLSFFHNQIEKMLLYGFKIPIPSSFSKQICVRATCCKTPKVIPVSKYCTATNLVGCCYHCNKVHTSYVNFAFCLYIKKFTDCRILFD